MKQDIKAGLLSLLGLVQQHIVAALKDLPSQGDHKRGSAWKELRRLKGVEQSLMECLEGDSE